jgi:DNA repair protein SbcC/Rad50
MSTEIKLNKLTIKNFKGIKSFEINFTEHEINILGANEAGKTSVYDAYHWLLFGKDSTDKKDFSIKPLDTIGKTNAETETSVVGYLDVNGLDIILKREYSEKWTKPRGQLEKVFSGNETTFFYNEVPLKENEYKAKISSIIDEELFKLLSNPLYFNSLKWEKRRQILIAISPVIEQKEIINLIQDDKLTNEIKNLVSALNQNKSIAEFKAEIASKKATVKKELVDIPSRIDEANKSLPEIIPVYSEVQKQIDELNLEISKIDNKISDKSQAVKDDFERIKTQQQEKFNLETKLQSAINNLSSGYNQKVSETQNEIKNKEREISALAKDISITNASISSNNNTINSLSSENDAIREDWKKTNSKELIFDDKQFSCPACNRELEADNIEATKKQLTESFNIDKAKKLKDLNGRGVANKTRIETLTKENESAKLQLQDTEKEKALLQIELDKLTTTYSSLTSESIIESDEVLLLKKQISEFVIDESPKVDISEFNQQKVELNQSIDVLKAQLSMKDTIDRINARIIELQKNQGIYAQELSNLEKQEFVIDNYNKAYMNGIESSVNKEFKYVDFKMFELQVNGLENPTCITTYKGIPFNDVNTAGQLFAGIDIINTLSKHYKVSVPMFLDNRESVTNIPETEAQIINLIVSPEHKKLTVKIN